MAGLPTSAPARARDLAVNVALPFLHGQAIREEKPVKAQLYLGLYRNYGKLQDNELTREMTDQLMEPGWSMVLTNARRQQGLIHLHRVLAGASFVFHPLTKDKGRRTEAPFTPGPKLIGQG